jgi:hypothetical protein
MTQIPEEIIKAFAERLLLEKDEQGNAKYTEEQVAQMLVDIEQELNNKNLKIEKQS